MPTYSYQCQSCDKQFDEVFKISEKPSELPCIHCEQGSAHSIITWKGRPIISESRFYSPVFGREFKNSKDMRDYAKFHGHVEVGTESPNTIEKWSSKEQDERVNKAYAEAQKDIEKDILSGNI